MLPFFPREGEGIAQAAGFQATRHRPAVVYVELARHIAQLDFVVVHNQRSHPFAVDPRPDGMSVSPPVLLMEDDGAGLTFQPELCFDLLDGLFKVLDGRVRAFGRVEAHREQMLFAARSPRNGIGFAECLDQIITDEAAHIMQFNMVVVSHRQKVVGELWGIAALLSLQNHGSLPGTLPRAAKSSARISEISRQASLISDSVSGETGKEPEFTALASWFMFCDRRD